MKNVLAKIWIPMLLVAIAAAQSFGIDAGRSAGLRRLADSLAFNQLQDTTDVVDSIISIRDTITIPDSLRFTDPLKFKYYIALKDSTIRAQIRDSLMSAGDTLEVMRLDSLFIKDSTETAAAEHAAWYASLTRKERKKYDAEQALPGLIAAANRKLEIKDSIRAYKDSVRESIPRILETFAIPDSLHYKRIVTWKHTRDFHNLVEVRDMAQDTSYKRSFNDYPFFNDDLNAAWLGVSGSPVQLYDWFKREEEDNAIFYSPYSIWNYTPENLPQYNTKTPYTELAYYGTLFSSQEKEESNVRVLTTQNITPQLNLTLEYRRYGGNGILKREDTNNKTFVLAANYLGKKYMMHAGYIYNKVNRSENGGIVDESWIRDTTVDAREIDIYLRDASNQLKKNTVFLDQTYRIPLAFLTDIKGAKERKRQEVVRDSIMASGDSVAIAALAEAEASRLALEAAQADTARMNTDITTAFIGHSSEYSVFSKTYTDKISDQFGKDRR